MSRSIVLFAVILFFSLNSMAQDEEHHQGTTSPVDRSKMNTEQIAQKLSLSKGQKDSLITIFTQFSEDVQKYQVRENDKVFNYLVKGRDEKVSKLLHDESRYQKYLLILEDLKKRQDSQQSQPQQQHHQGQHNQMGGGKGF